MPLLRVAIAVDAAEVEPAVAAWEIAGVHNSSVEYQFDEPSEEPWPSHDNRLLEHDAVEVAAYIDADQWQRIEPKLRDAAQRLLRESVVSAAAMPDRDWRTAWHDHFDIVRIPGERPIVVRPPHKVYRAAEREIVIELVPGLAFGTGQHQSTRLCLRLLAEHVANGSRVLDVGTGSGILACAAALLGAESVIATDIDPLAVDAARQTVRQNGLADIVDVREGAVPEGGEPFDLVAANLTADILQWLAADIARAVKPGGTLIASGLIAARQDDVAAAFESQGLHTTQSAAEDDWIGLVFCAEHTHPSHPRLRWDDDPRPSSQRSSFQPPPSFQFVWNLARHLA